MVAYLLHLISASWAESAKVKALADLRIELTAQCNADKKITEDISHEYQNRLSDLDKRLAAAKRVQPHKCVSVTPSATTGHNAATTATGDAGRDVVNSESLIDYAGKAEKYQRQLESCQAFIKRVIP
jgi:hypothetical protein